MPALNKINIVICQYTTDLSESNHNNKTTGQGNNDPSNVCCQFLMDANVMYITFISGVSAFCGLCEKLPWPSISNTGE